MANLSNLLFITFSLLVLTACSAETQPATPDVTSQAAEALPLEPDEGPNYCAGADYDASEPYRFVVFNLAIKEEEMQRLRAAFKAELAAINALPQEALAEAVEPYLAKKQILSELVSQSQADYIVPATAELCNFDLYKADECTGRLSGSVRKASRLADSLSFTAPNGRGQTMRVFVSHPNYSDVMLEGPQGTSHWFRNSDGVESFTFKDAISETRWAENPDCSGQLFKRRKEISFDVTWTSPKDGAFAFTYKHCRDGACYEGRF